MKFVRGFWRKKENIAIARVQVKNDGTSFSYGPAENHHKEEHC